MSFKPSESTEDFELHRLRDEYPNAQQQNGVRHSYDEDDDADSFVDVEEDGNRALLSPQVRRERDSGDPDTVWHKIRDVVLEAAPTLLLMTISLLFTGELLDKVSHWQAMQLVDQLIMIIPVVLNLKGNLEMNLSARLGTSANTGELDEPSSRNLIIFGNLSLLQAQAAVVSFIAACVAFVLGLIIPRMPPPSVEELPVNARRAWRSILPNPRALKHNPSIPPGTRRSGFAEFTMVTATSMTAACLSSLILGSFMCFLVVLCRYFGRNPDNIAPPIASCLGDLVTLILIGIISTFLIQFIYTPIPLILSCLVLAFALSCAIYSRKNPHVKHLLWEGWSPLFGAMIISSGTGIVLDLFVTRYEGFALLAVVISGLPGGVGSIFISRLSTALHAASKSTSYGAKSLRDIGTNATLIMYTLLVITIPVEIIFLAVLTALGWLKMPFVFVVFSMVFFCCAVMASLFIGRLLTNFLWSRKLDPDIYALPVHSALMDLIGQLLLVLCFEIVSLMGVHVSEVRGPKVLPG